MGLTKEILALLSTGDAEKDERIAELEARMTRIEDDVVSLQRAYADMGEAILDYLDEINRKIVSPQGAKKRNVLLVRDL